MALLAFNQDAAIRTAAIERLKRVAAAGKFTGGVLAWNGEEGSMAGALAETDDAQAWQDRLGLPRWFAYALDTITQPLGVPEAIVQTSAILGAVAVGRDMAPMGSVLMCMLLNEVAAAAQPEGALAEALSDILVLHHRRMRDDLVTPADWRKARSAAGRAVSGPTSDSANGSDGGDDEEFLPLAQARVLAVGHAIEAAAWDPMNSPSSVSDVLRQWLKLEGLKSDEEFGWTDQDNVFIRAQLQEMYDTYIAHDPESEGAGNTVFDHLEKHRPEAHARLKAYEQHGYDHRVRCAERACALFQAHLKQGELTPG